jgi:hypothetical protein
MSNSNLSKIKFTFIFIFIFILLFFYYLKLDYNVGLEKEFFNWDSYQYYLIAKNFEINKIYFYPAESPYNERIIFPILLKISSVYLLKNYSLTYNALFINLIGIIISFICFFKLGFFLKLKKKNLIFSSIIFLTLWAGPLRSSIYYPGAPFGFDTGLITLISTLIYFFFINSKKNIILYLIIILIILISTFQRGIVITFITLIPFIEALFRNIKVLKNKNIFLFLKKIKYEIILLISGLISLLLLKTLLAHHTGSYSMMRNIIKYSYHNLNIINFIYPIFVSFGIFFLLMILYLIFLIQKKNKINNSHKFFLLIITYSIFISKIGGDSDRPLLWFWPFFLIIAIKFYEKNLLNNKFKFLLLITTILWTRAFVPAIPNYIYSYSFINTQFVTTNFDKKLFYGPNFLKKYQNEMEKKSLVHGSPYNDEDLFKNFFIPKGKYNLNCSTIMCHPNPYISSYKYQINNIPFPLGYMHNQRDALIDNPIFGQAWVIYSLTLQWILLTIVFVYNINKKIINNIIIKLFKLVF